MDKDKKNLLKQSHYNQGGFEVIDIAEAFGIDKCAYTFNVLKYILRAPFKTNAPVLEHLIKARYYLDRKIKNLQKENGDIRNQSENEDSTGRVRKKQKGHKGKRRR